MANMYKEGFSTRLEWFLSNDNTASRLDTHEPTETVPACQVHLLYFSRNTVDDGNFDRCDGIVELELSDPTSDEGTGSGQRHGLSQRSEDGEEEGDDEQSERHGSERHLG
jgi:hypothetical protein